MPRTRMAADVAPATPGAAGRAIPLVSWRALAGAAALGPTLLVALVLSFERDVIASIAAVPVLLAAAGAAAGTGAYLLWALARTLGDERLRWLPYALALEAATFVVNGVQPGLETVAVSGPTEPDTAAALIIARHLLLATVVLLSLRATTRRFVPVVLVAWLGLLVAAVVLAALDTSLGVDLLTEGGLFTTTGNVIGVVAALGLVVAAAAWIRSGPVRRQAPEAWIAVALVIGATCATCYAISDAERTSLWWVALTLAMVQFALPAAGLTVSTVGLLRSMDRHERHLEVRVAELLDRARRGDGVAERDEELVRSLLAPGVLRPVFQPIVELDTGGVVGYEALARFEVAGESVSPAEAFAAGERCGMGVELELHAARMACEAFAGAVADRPDAPWLSINASPRTLADPGFAQAVDCVSPDRLVVEVTEREAIVDYAAVAERLAPLRDAGLRLAVDDTGSGYAGLGHLVGLRPHVIKLDVELCREIERDTVRGALASALVDFARAVGAELVAEGIETESSLDALRSLGLELGQGYLLGRPAPLP